MLPDYSVKDVPDRSLNADTDRQFLTRDLRGGNGCPGTVLLRWVIGCLHALVSGVGVPRLELITVGHMALTAAIGVKLVFWLIRFESGPPQDVVVS